MNNNNNNNNKHLVPYPNVHTLVKITDVHNDTLTGIRAL